MYYQLEVNENVGTIKLSKMRMAFNSERVHLEDKNCIFKYNQYFYLSQNRRLLVEKAKELQSRFIQNISKNITELEKRKSEIQQLKF